jgi:4-hydroxy-3-polyprenylbenzoate decarboxylase
VVAGVDSVHAVDAAGVHPLLLAIAHERYVPYATVRRPQEILTIANALLGQGQLSLAKYLLIVAREDSPSLDIHDIAAFLRHLLERVDWANDLHFQTRTTVDTLDYSGHGFNQGSKLVIAAAGPVRRALPTELRALKLPDGFREPRVVLPGILAIETGPYRYSGGEIASFCGAFPEGSSLREFALIVIVDDSSFVAASLRNFIWVTFTRSDPAADIDGVGSFTDKKHWGCAGPLVIDARIKPHHAPPLVDDPAIEHRVDALAAPGGPLHGIY